MDFFNVSMLNMGSLIAFAPIVIALSLWSLFWKGLALWHSAQRKQGWWFIIMLIVNTVGILEIIYLFAILKLKTSELFPASPAQPSSPEQHSSQQQ